MAKHLEIQSRFRRYTVEFSDDAVNSVSKAVNCDLMFVVCDQNVFEKWSQYLTPLMQSSHSTLLSPCEATKTMAESEGLMKKMIDAGVRRNSTIVVIGGGITQDVTAFAASLLYRGVEWVFVPTTLLAQADSCVGSKTSINVGHMKNLAGNYWPPSRVIEDPRFLTSLTADDVRSGFGEMLHFYLYADSEHTRALVADIDVLLNERDRILPYVKESLRIKKSVVELDEFDEGERRKFNYGHTFGHAIESVTDYAIPHGLAVTLGMDVANFVAMRLGIMKEPCFAELHCLLKMNFPTRRHETWPVEQYLSCLMRDKKNVADSIGCVLAERPGRLVVHQIKADGALRGIVEEYFAGDWWR